MDSGFRRLLRPVGWIPIVGLLCLLPAPTATGDADVEPAAAKAGIPEAGAAGAPESDETADDAGDAPDPEPWRPFLHPPGFGGHTPWVAPNDLIVDWVGHGRARQLREARFQFHLATEQPSRAGDEGWRDPQHLEDYEDVVLSAWGKVVRNALEDATGIERRWDRWWDRKMNRVRGGDGGGERSPWHLRLSPRISEDRMAMKLRLPNAGLGLVRSLSFRVRYDWTEDQMSWILKLDDGDRFVHFGFEPGTRDEGDRLELSVRLAW